MKIERFEDIPAWKLSLQITRDIYDLSAGKQFSKDFGLRDQIRRAVISVSSNIVEGFEKNNNNEFIRYLKIAKGSLGEVRNCLYVALSIGYLRQQEFDRLNEKCLELAGQLGGFVSYLSRVRSQGQFILKK